MCSDWVLECCHMVQMFCVVAGVLLCRCNGVLHVLACCNTVGRVFRVVVRVMLFRCFEF